MWKKVIIIKILEILLELIYPNVCGICEEINKNSLCEKCKQKIDSIKIEKIDNYKSDKSKFFDNHGYLFKYEGEIRKILINYKFNEKAYLCKTFTRTILNSEKICDFISLYDILIPVPIHKNRLKQRGYNQSELIAKELIEEFKDLKLLQRNLIKIKNNSAQSQLKKEERLSNVNGVYKILNHEILYNKRVLLLDDIYTTGNTVNECARILRTANVKDIGVLTIAKD